MGSASRGPNGAMRQKDGKEQLRNDMYLMVRCSISDLRQMDETTPLRRLIPFAVLNFAAKGQKTGRNAWSAGAWRPKTQTIIQFWCPAQTCIKMNAEEAMLPSPCKHGPDMA